MQTLTMDDIYSCTEVIIGGTPGGVLKFGFGRDVPPRNLKVDPYKHHFFKKK